MEELRLCKKCSNLLPFSIFRKDRNYVTYTCQPCHLDFLKQYRQKNKKRISLQQAEWHQNNKEYVLNRRKSTPQLKISNALRVRLNLALKANQKQGSAVEDLGCSVVELKNYLESKFQPGMTWDNWSRDGWHIDHVRPLASFDLTSREQLLKACHYTNLQPLWAKDNLSKGDSDV